MKKIIITGANGFIGSAIAKKMSEAGFMILALDVQPTFMYPFNVTYIQFKLGERINDKVIREADFLIHCAFVKYPDVLNAREINLNGTKLLIQQAKENNLKKIVYITSMSAHANAQSVYGQSKYEIEQIFDPAKDLIVRPGLVIGNGGLFKNISLFISKSSLIPLIGSGNAPVQYIYINDLLYCIKRGIDENICGLYNLAAPRPTSLREIYKLIANNKNKKILFVTLPYNLIFLIFNVLNLFKINIGVGKENLLGLRFSHVFEVANSNKVFELNPKNINEILKEL